MTPAICSPVSSQGWPCSPTVRGLTMRSSQASSILLLSSSVVHCSSPRIKLLPQRTPANELSSRRLGQGKGRASNVISLLHATKGARDEQRKDVAAEVEH
jgi:hypothetical protein